MTTQQTTRALAREAAGLFLTAFGALGALVALSALHWAAGAITAMSGLTAAGLMLRRTPSTKGVRHLSAGAVGVGYAGITACTFALHPALGVLGVSLAAAAAGLLLASDEGAA
ncbi:hypothetical protein [Streptomyces sp. NPDC046685]|uniref:hypothetical protein n=1 Tax=Streptomyces sp. NPDC046685 TaxID=3157202 RepID=UPI0033FC2BD5